MPLSDLRLGIVFVFFIYGLAFFSMGIALLLETGRFPQLAERRVLQPLAAFGLLHGIHEWAEIILLQGVWLGLPFPTELSWLRIGWLAVSFIPLVAFGLLLMDANRGQGARAVYLSLGLLALYVSLLLVHARLDPAGLAGRADALARYTLAVPGGVLAGLALGARARQVRAEGRRELASAFRWAALGFGVYGLTQIFVSPVDMFPAQAINSQSFSGLFGFPVQVVRAAMALLVTTCLIRAIQLADRERDDQLLAAQRARLEALEMVQRDLVEREALRRQLLRHIVTAQEDERARIARELHDETAQFLTALNLNLGTLRNSIPRQRQVDEILERVQALLRDMSQGIYRMVHDLRPAQLDDLGLVAALQYLADEERMRAGLEVSLKVEGPKQRLDPLVETVLFRVAQEALTNVARHARSDRAKLQLSFFPSQVVLCVRDEGIGFTLDERKIVSAGLGLAGMRERAESVGGVLSLHSSPERGTTVEVSIPIAEPEPLEREEPSYEYHPHPAGRRS